VARPIEKKRKDWRNWGNWVRNTRYQKEKKKLKRMKKAISAGKSDVPKVAKAAFVKKGNNMLCNRLDGKRAPGKKLAEDVEKGGDHQEKRIRRKKEHVFEG